MITRINEAKTFTKHILCDGKCKFDGIKCNLNQNNDKCWHDCKNSMKFRICGKDYV